MEYPGNQQLSSQAQERVLTAFRQAVQKLQEGGREEAMIALEFVLRLDPKFGPAQHLHQQLTSGASEIDLSAIVGQLQDPANTQVDQLLVDAVDDFNERRFHQAKEKVDRVLLELPGHKEGRDLLRQIEEALKVEAQVGQYLVQARQALDRGDPEESANFVMMAQALDPHHPGIATVLAEFQERGVPGPPPEAPGPAPDEVPAGDTGEGFEFGFETTELPMDGGSAGSPFDADFGNDEPLPGEASPAAEAAADAGMDELFEAGDDMEAPVPPPDDDGSGETSDQVKNLLIQGEEAFQNGDLDTAIDLWSRVFLTDPSNTEVTHLIEQARKRRAESRREVESLLSEALEAARGGRPEDAARLLNDLLKQEPTNLPAIELAEQLEAGEIAEAPPEEPAPPPAGVPGEPAVPDTLDDLGVDLFEAEPSPSPEAGEAPETMAGLLDSFEDEEPLEEEPPTRRRGLGAGLPVRAVALGAGAVLVLALGIWFGLSFFGGGGTGEGIDQQALQQSLVEAEKLFKEGRAREAVHLLENLNATGPDRARVERRLERYRQALLPPTPTPVPDEAVSAREALEAGRWLEAYRLIQKGLAAHPEDPGLMELREQALQVDSAVVPLLKAESDGDYETAVGICRDLLDRHPDNQEVLEELGRNLFNLAVMQLRAYNLTGAEVNLSELATMDPEDDEVQRILEFVERYKVRPVDMQLKIFISSLKLR